MADFVKPLGGEYFFVPSLRFLRRIKAKQGARRCEKMLGQSAALPPGPWELTSALASACDSPDFFTPSSHRFSRPTLIGNKALRRAKIGWQAPFFHRAH